MWYVYILECRNKSLYTGITTDIKRRFKQHQKGKAAAYTSSFKPTKIRHAEQHHSRSGALKREAEIKKLSRNKKLTLIKEKLKKKKLGG
ncbi:MAG: GIY-YIG nuclease family protein [bacterium]